jgi:abortive infection alpha-like protein
VHPAYERILQELAPDEGRILRLLATEGPEPAVDVRGSKPLAVSSEMVAPGLNMIGAKAGCRYTDRLPAYLNNLYRLGLIWFSREPLDDPLRYQVLEAQPAVLDALRDGRRSKTVRRSIHLTPFGEDFCEVCLPLHTAELEALPGDATEAEEPTDREREDRRESSPD